MVVELGVSERVRMRIGGGTGSCILGEELFCLSFWSERRRRKSFFKLLGGTEDGGGELGSGRDMGGELGSGRDVGRELGSGRDVVRVVGGRGCGGSRRAVEQRIHLEWGSL